MNQEEEDILLLGATLAGSTEIAFTHSGGSDGERSVDDGSAGTQQRTGDGLAEHCDDDGRGRREGDL